MNKFGDKVEYFGGKSAAAAANSEPLVTFSHTTSLAILAALFIISQMRQFDDFLTNLTGGSNSTTTMAIKIVAFIVIAYLVIPSCE